MFIKKHLNTIYSFVKAGKIILGVLTLFLIQITSLKAAQPAPQPRQRININREWKFILGDQKNAELSDYKDTGWDDVNLPHSFSTPYFQTGQWYVGYGWYRKYINVPAIWKGKRICIEFEGAFRDAEVFVNGKPVGHHQSGYTGFCYDITEAVVTGKNVLAVRLNNLWNARLAPRDGDHNFCGGIYRDVYLVVTNPTHIAWYGTFVTTPKVSKASGIVNIKTEVANNSTVSKTCRLKTTVLDPSGKVADVFSSSLKINAGATVTFDQTGKPIHNPKLWHPLYPFYIKLLALCMTGKL
jgi:beta-galactosidase